MSELHKAFTARANGIANCLITECGVCHAFDPLRSPSVKHPDVSKFQGLWDTGASGTVITKKVVDALGLKPIGKAKINHANGSSIVNKYVINLFLPNQVAFKFIQVTEGILSGFDVLIGMDIMNRGDFAISNYNGKTTFTFRVPSLEEVDYVPAPKRTPITSSSKKVGRNQPCPCGSGKKYKHCHGKNK